MAVRRQLQKLLQDPQLSGVITVERSLPPAAAVTAERSLSPAAATWVLQPTTSTLLSSLPSSPPRRQGPLPEDCAVFQCRGCWTVLGDSLYLCTQEWRLGVLVCFKVTNDVAWGDSLMIGLEGALLGCAYHALSCRSCGLVVGFTLYSAARNLAYLRGLFCFFMDSIVCYLLKTKKIIEASKVIFPAVTLKEKLQEVKGKIVEVHFRLESLMKQLEELEQRNNEAERPSTASDTVSLPSGYVRVRVN